jgi:hypothetical protein
VIDVGGVRLVDGPSVKIDDGLGRLVRVSITNGATFPKGPGVLGVAIFDGSGCVIVVVAVILVEGLSVKIEDGSKRPV